MYLKTRDLSADISSRPHLWTPPTRSGNPNFKNIAKPFRMFHPRLGASPEKGPSGLTGDPLVSFELLSPLFHSVVASDPHGVAVNGWFMQVAASPSLAHSRYHRRLELPPLAGNAERLRCRRPASPLFHAQRAASGYISSSVTFCRG